MYGKNGNKSKTFIINMSLNLYTRIIIAIIIINTFPYLPATGKYIKTILHLPWNDFILIYDFQLFITLVNGTNLFAELPNLLRHQYAVDCSFFCCCCCYCYCPVVSSERYWQQKWWFFSSIYIFVWLSFRFTVLGLFGSENRNKCCSQGKFYFLTIFEILNQLQPIKIKHNLYVKCFLWNANNHLTI